MNLAGTPDEFRAILGLNTPGFRAPPAEASRQAQPWLQSELAESQDVVVDALVQETGFTRSDIVQLLFEEGLAALTKKDELLTQLLADEPKLVVLRRKIVDR